MNSANGNGAVHYLRNRLGAGVAHALIGHLPPVVQDEIETVIDDLSHLDEGETAAIVDFLAAVGHALVASSLSEIVKFADLRHRANVREALGDFTPVNGCSMQQGELTDAAVLHQWLEVYAARFHF